jgi:hypothetical protein
MARSADRNSFGVFGFPGTRFFFYPLSNQSMKPAAPSRSSFNVIATTPCRGLCRSRWAKQAQFNVWLLKGSRAARCTNCQQISGKP